MKYRDAVCVQLDHLRKTQMPRSDEEIEQAVRNVVGSFRIEGLHLTEDEIARVRGIAAGELDVDEEVAKLLKQYDKTNSEPSDD